jgi:MFS transporter, ACS family, aldohexuronate transporter
MSRTQFRWIIIGLIFFITLINYIDRASISFAIGDISQELQLNASQQGLILGAFGIGYIITTFFGGIAVDRFGSRIVLLICVFLWSIATLFTGFAFVFLMIYLARALLGVAEGPNFPALTRAVSDWLAPHERAIALGNTLVAVPLAIAIGAPIVSSLIVYAGWRGMFIILGLIGLAWIPIWWFLFRDSPEKSRYVNESELNHIRSGDHTHRPIADKTELSTHKSNKGTWAFLLSNPTLLANNWSFFVFGYFLFFFMTWLPSYLQTTQGLNLHEVGIFVFIPWVVAALMLYVTGYISDIILRRTGNLRYARSYLIWISQLLAAMCVIPIIFTTSLSAEILFITLAVGFSMSANASYYVINVDIAKERAGTSLGIMDTGFAISGAIAPVLTGYLINLTGNYNIAFWILALLGLSSVLVVFCFHHPERAKKFHEVVR